MPVVVGSVLLGLAAIARRKTVNLVETVVVAVTVLTALWSRCPCKRDAAERERDRQLGRPPRTAIRCPCSPSARCCRNSTAGSVT
jgi:hypothetical protein